MTFHRWFKIAIQFLLFKLGWFGLLEKTMNDEQKEKFAILRLRATMKSFGYPMGDVSDEEIIEGEKRMHETLSKTGLTSAEMLQVAASMNNLAELVKKEPIPGW